MNKRFWFVFLIVLCNVLFVIFPLFQSIASLQQQKTVLLTADSAHPEPLWRVSEKAQWMQLQDIDAWTAADGVTVNRRSLRKESLPPYELIRYDIDLRTSSSALLSLMTHDLLQDKSLLVEELRLRREEEGGTFRAELSALSIHLQP